MKELLNKIGITKAGHFSNSGEYIIEFENDTEYNKAFSKLDRTELVEENPDGGAVTLNTSIVVYSNDDFTLQLVSDFDNDNYKLIVKEVEN